VPIPHYLYNNGSLCLSFIQHEVQLTTDGVFPAGIIKRHGIAKNRCVHFEVEKQLINAIIQTVY